MNGYTVSYGPVATFDAGDLVVRDDGTAVDCDLTVDGATTRLHLTPAQAQSLLLGLHLTGTSTPDWLV